MDRDRPDPRRPRGSHPSRLSWPYPFVARSGRTHRLHHDTGRNTARNGTVGQSAIGWTLLLAVKWVFEQVEAFACDVALEATPYLAGGRAFLAAPLDVGAGCFVVASALKEDDVDRPVQRIRILRGAPVSFNVTGDSTDAPGFDPGAPGSAAWHPRDIDRRESGVSSSTRHPGSRSAKDR